MTTTPDLWKALASIKTAIQAADSKAAAFLTIAGVLIAFPAPAMLVRPDASRLQPAAAIFAVLAAMLFMLSVGAALSVLFPRTRNKTTTSSLIYFGDIAGYKAPDFERMIAAADDEQLRADLIAQIHINAQICSTKHAHFKAAVTSLVSGMVSLAIAYIVVAVTAAGP
ncbi:Pycsar system effector family protein [Luteitalea sp.]